MEEKKSNYSRRYSKDYHIFRTIFHMAFLYAVVNPYLYFYYKIKIEGQENLPKNRSVVYASNHVSEIDPPLVSVAIKRPIAYMAKKELFDDSEKRSWLIKRLGGFSVDREKPEISTFKTARDIFKTSWGLGIFPEGGTRKNKKIEDIHKGFVVLAKSAKTDIVPISIVGFEDYSKKFRSEEVKIVIGSPISYKLEADQIVQLWCEEICKNTGFENCVKAQVVV